MPPSTGQLTLLIAAMLLFIAGGLASVARFKLDRAELRLLSKGLLIAGIFLNICVITWHDSQRDRWLPVEDNFDALVWLATLLSLFVLYVQWHRPLDGLDWFVMP